MPRVHLGGHQGHHGPMADIVEGDLPDVHRDVLEAIHHQITPGVKGPSSVVCHQLDGVQFLC